MTETYAFMGYELPVPLVNITGGGPDTFAPISAAHIADLKRYLGVGERSRLLEIGCGIGRDAIPLAEIVTNGRYVGMDIIGDSIRWLDENVTPRHPHFTFHHFDISDQLHNPSGHIESQSIQFPSPDDSIDAVFAWSVFTHMYGKDIEHYLRESARVLRSGGRMFATCFLVDENVIASAQGTNLTKFDIRFEHEIEPGCYINDPDHPLGAVGYTRERLTSMVAKSGLQLDRIAFGGWSGYWEEVEGGQDALLLWKP